MLDMDSCTVMIDIFNHWRVMLCTLLQAYSLRVRRMSYVKLVEGIPGDWPIRGEGSHVMRYLLDEGIVREVCSFLA